MVPFVGREKELEVLAQHWRRAQAGEPQHLLIAGDAGIGKTRLVDELVAAVRGDQAQVLSCWRQRAPGASGARATPDRCGSSSVCWRSTASSTRLSNGTTALAPPG
jgi:Cdc6-like AAA superfamily ATPase